MTFDLYLRQLLDEPQFRCITKIKTIGSTYMAASGVTPDANNGYSCMKVIAKLPRPAEPLNPALRAEQLPAHL